MIFLPFIQAANIFTSLQAMLYKTLITRKCFHAFSESMRHLSSFHVQSVHEMCVVLLDEQTAK